MLDSRVGSRHSQYVPIFLDLAVRHSLLWIYAKYAVRLISISYRPDLFVRLNYSGIVNLGDLYENL